MKKKLLSMMLALSMVLTLLPGTAFAGEVTFDYVDGKWTVSGESGSYTVDGTSITYTITLGTSSIEIKADSDAEGKADIETLPDNLTDAQKDALGSVTVRSEDLGLLPQDHEDIAEKLTEAGWKALEEAGSAGDKDASVNLGLGVEITDAVFDKNDQATFLALEITAVYTVTIDGKESESSVLTFGYPIELTVAVPEGILANEANVSIEHSKDGSSYHPHTVSGIDRTNNTVTFTSTDGLSPFTISNTQPSDGPTTPSTPSDPSTPSGPSAPSGGPSAPSGGPSAPSGGSSAPSGSSTPSISNNTDIEDHDAPLAGRPFLFEDVTEGDWFYDDVNTAFELNLMAGVSDTKFDPNSNTTRGMVAQILYRLEGKPSIDGYNVTIPDLKDTDWYHDAAIWAYATGTYEGYTDGTFRGNELVTREQLALVIYRYSKQKGYDVSASDDLSAFVDKGNISSWALEGVQWAIGAELIRGRNGSQIAPDANTTRAELATILVRFVNAFTDLG